MALFDAKNFNGEVFGAYVDIVPNLNRNELLKSRAVVEKSNFSSMLSEQVGGNYVTTPIKARIDGDAVNYDGSTNIEATSRSTYTQSRIVVGRAKAWEEKDFSSDITGEDFMPAATEVAEYWDDVDQATILSTLKGIFSMTGTENLKFVNGHTLDITADTANTFTEVTLNKAVQKALGDNKSKFALAVMHSAVATNLENLKLLSYLKYTDASGVERDLAIGTLNGRTVLVDDNMPVGGTDEAPVYTTYLLGEGAIEYTNVGAEVPYEMDRNPAAAGGKTIMYSRQRKIFAPYGISFTNTTIMSPTAQQLETGSNWALANGNASTDNKYFPHKAIPIARVLSLG